MSIPNLPLDLWAQVARFVPASERPHTYRALRAAMLIPTHRTEHETQMRFLEVAGDEERANALATRDDVWPTAQPLDDMGFYDLVDMGFGPEQVVWALRVSDGNLGVAFIALLHT